MIIQFAVENYRSIKDEQVLSLVKSTGDEMPDNYFQSSAPKTPPLLKSAVIYGANASGKSNIMKGLYALRYFIDTSFNKNPKQLTIAESFLFDKNTLNEPTVLDISVIIPLQNDNGELQDMRVDYGFVVDKERVYEEWLSVYPKGRERNWFHREYNQEKDDYDWKMSDYLKGEKESWKNQTRFDQLFLSTAVHLKGEQLYPIYKFLTIDMTVIGVNRIGNEFSKKLCKNNLEKNILINLLNSVGIDVSDIIFKKVNVNSYELVDESLPEDVKVKVAQQIEQEIVAQNETFFVYYDDNGSRIEINLNQESDGTQKLFEFAGLILYVLYHGYVLVVDELNNSLHPDLVRFLVKLFNSEYNKSNAQLIFTTHETSVLRKDLLRRDQIWFCEKGRDRSTTLYPLSDFKPHIEHEDIEEYYLHGRYGAKPIITDFNFPEDFFTENK